MKQITVECRAKINLTLDVLDKRPDGFHNIESIMQSITLSDVLTISRTDRSEIILSVNIPGLPTGPENTVYKACSLFKEAAQIEEGVNVSIEKRVPHQAGLGGGSSDAAGALVGLNELFGEPLDPGQLHQIAARIGSDVPFFLTGGTAFSRGRGEIISKLPNAPQMDLVVVKPDVGVPTPWAYGALSKSARHISNDSTVSAMDAISRGDSKGLITSLSNDFQDVVSSEFPDIAAILSQMLEYGSEKSILCGSGAAVFGVFASPEAAEVACSHFRAKYPFAATASTTNESLVRTGA